MGSFKVFAKISGLIDAATPEEAQKHAERVLTHLLEPKGFDVVGVAHTGQRPAEVPAAEEAHSDPGAARLLKTLEKELFREAIRLSSPRTRNWRGGTIHEYPLTIEIDGYDATGQIVELPPDVMREPVPANPDDPESEPDTGDRVDAPEGHHVYAWSAKVALEPEQVGKANIVAAKITKEMVSGIERNLKGKVLTSSHAIGTDPDTEEPVSLTRGIFTAPVPPDAMAKVAAEQLGMRSVLPKSVAEAPTEWDAPLAGLLKSLKS